MNSRRRQKAAAETRICLENYAGKLQEEMNLYLLQDVGMEELLSGKILWVESVTVTHIEFPAVRNPSFKNKTLSCLRKIRSYLTGLLKLNINKK